MSHIGTGLMGEGERRGRIQKKVIRGGMPRDQWETSNKGETIWEVPLKGSVKEWSAASGFPEESFLWTAGPAPPTPKQKIYPLPLPPTSELSNALKSS